MVYEKMFYFIILTLVFFKTLIGRCYALFCPWQMFLPGRCYLPYEMWQMLLPQRKMLFLFFCEWHMLLPYDVVEDVIPLYNMLQHIVLADVIARWQME